MPNPPSIADIARHLSMAPSTVSKVLGPHAERYRISDDTRQRIIACAKDLGYAPDLKNRARATRRTGMVGVLYATPSPTTQEVFERFGEVAVEQLRSQGYQLCYLPASNWDEVRQRLAEHRVDGCLMLPPIPVRDATTRLPVAMPLVLVNALTDLPVPHVLTDDAQGVGLLVDHLAGLGHRHIAYADVTSRPGDPSGDAWQQRGYITSADLPLRPFGHYSEAWRRRGYHEAVARLGLPPQEFCGDAEGLLRQLISGECTAVITYNHQLALALAHLARAQGLAVPERFSFACASDPAYGALMDPAWTAVPIPLEAMVRRAVEELVLLMEGRTALGHAEVIIPQTIQVRASTGPVPDR